MKLTVKIYRVLNALTASICSARCSFFVNFVAHRLALRVLSHQRVNFFFGKEFLSNINTGNIITIVIMIIIIIDYITINYLLYWVCRA